jgi:hypothetical protein
VDDVEDGDVVGAGDGWRDKRSKKNEDCDSHGGSVSVVMLEVNVEGRRQRFKEARGGRQRDKRVNLV